MTGGASDERKLKDKSLFDNIALRYAEKDVRESSRIARKMRLLQTIGKAAFGPNVDILEIGCGAGYASEYLSQHYRSFTGIDYSEELIKLAREINLRPNVFFQVADLFEFHSDRKFDVIFMIGVLHHMPDVQKAISICSGLLKPGGVFIANEPHSANIVCRMLRKIRSRVDRDYSDEQEEMEQAELLDNFKRSGLTDVTACPQGFFSTPFAEVILRPQGIMRHASAAACRIDAVLEKRFGGLLGKASWNVIVSGRKVE
ncbi:MAG: class I SAM-dependent methyltransferase [Gammaproteobacteria bacterium]